MSDQDTNQPGGMPPKQSPFKPIQPANAQPSADPMASPRTVILKKPAGLRPVPPPPAAPRQDEPTSPLAGAPAGIVLTHEQAAKKKTARINVASATAPIVPPQASPDGDPRSIRLRNPAEEAAPAPAPAPAQPRTSSFTPVQPPVTKSKTSRITLDTALSSSPSLPHRADPPKTIRLKRPGDMTPPSAPQVAIKTPTTNIPLPPLAAAAPSPIKLSSPNAPEPAPEEEPSPTRKKTIKVRRPGSASPEHKFHLNKEAISSIESESENLQDFSSPEGLNLNARAPDKVNPAFIVAAVIAILVTINLLWVFAAQAFGPQAAVADFAKLSGPALPAPPGAQSVNY